MITSRSRGGAGARFCVLIALALLGVATLAYASAWARNQPPPRLPGPESQPGEKATTTTIRLLQARVALLQLRLAERERICADREAGERAQPPALPTPAAAVDEGLATLGTTAFNEAPDPSWAPGAEQRLRALGEALPPGTSLHGIRCGRTLCRLDLAGSGGAPIYNQVAKWLGRQRDFSPSTILQPAPSGEGTTMFIARAGTSLSNNAGGGSTDDEGEGAGLGAR